MTSSSLCDLGAIEALTRLRAQEIGSRDLLEACLARVDALNPKLNAVVARDHEAARARADEADRATRRGESWGPLHGLPMTLKDAWEVPGMTCVGGAPEYRQHRPQKAGPAIQRVLDAGAICFGKTNVPYKSVDMQTYNTVFGTTCNPWDLDRTPGGSSGGSAVALATGMTPLEVGSDIGGSIRLPAHFCGVYGHKTSHGLIPMRGHVPGEPGSVSEPPLVVAGPMARSADDLGLLFDILLGPAPAMQPGWTQRLPQSSHTRIDQYRVLIWTDDPDCPIDTRMAEVYRQLGQSLKAAGVQVAVGSPLGMGLKDIYPLYFAQMGSVMGAWLRPDERRAKGMVAPFGKATSPLMRGLGKLMSLPHSADRLVEGLTGGLGGWFSLVEEGNRLAEAFRTVFDRYDVVLMPPTYTPAFAHDHGYAAMRQIRVDGRRRHYSDLLMWIAPATLMGLPVTNAPVGRTVGGLPVGVQIMGGPYQDRVTLHFAKLLADVMGGFVKPPVG
jgi:amidase